MTSRKARLNALAEDRRKNIRDKRAREAQGLPSRVIGRVLKWPADEIEARLHLNDTQRAAL